MTRFVITDSLKKRLSFIIFTLILVFLFGLVNIEHTSLGIPEPLFPISEETEIVFDIVFWIAVGLFVIELTIAYLEIRNLQIFLRKNWLEIILLSLMFVFGGFELLRISLPTLDQIKISKTSFKLLKISVALIDQIKISKIGFRNVQKPNSYS
ncbi:hypothetical protein [Nitrosopumilus sp. b3]|uniref:hypothetical protein n=1 Tax=Nitrosopumilus sp. b3 TaxID=2109909 RepID=UPI0015F6FF8E|nr:hypothetical protein [Nitrosopumilus sp. b3]